MPPWLVARLTVLRGEAVRSVYQVFAGTGRDDDFLDVVGVCTKASPGRSASVIRQLHINGSDIVRGIGVCDVVAEGEEIWSVVGRPPIELLPGVAGIVHWATQGKGDLETGQVC